MQKDHGNDHKLNIYIDGNNLYRSAKELGFKLIFKQTILSGGKIKGNCDTELTVKVMSDYHEDKCKSVIIITGDGDFGCLIEFLKHKVGSLEVIAPDYKKCSKLIKNKYIKITFLNDLYHKFSHKIGCDKNEKAPDTDASA